MFIIQNKIFPKSFLRWRETLTDPQGFRPSVVSKTYLSEVKFAEDGPTGSPLNFAKCHGSLTKTCYTQKNMENLFFMTNKEKYGSGILVYHML